MVEEEALVARSLALRLPSDHELEPHRHVWGQLVYATEGVMTVETEGRAWVVPSHRAVWVPAGTLHGVRTTGRVRMRTVYLSPALCGALPETCSVLAVSPLLRELLLEVVRRRMLSDAVPEERRLARVLVDQIRLTPAAALEITWPSDARARSVAERVRADCASPATLRELSEGSGASVRTLERLFVRETGLTFERWRQRLRVLTALRHLAAGESVTATALAVGFNGTSAFIAMFKRTLGETPGRYHRPTGREVEGT